MKTITNVGLLPVGTEVQIVVYGSQQKTPYIGCTGRVLGVDEAKNLMWIILDNDPVPRWRDIGILCYPWEVRSLG